MSKTTTFKSRYGLGFKSASEKVSHQSVDEEGCKAKLCDKENNNVYADQGNTTRMLSSQCSGKKSKPVIPKVASKNSSAQPCDSNCKSNEVAPTKPRPRSSIAASYLSKTADGLASKRNQHLEANDAGKLKCNIKVLEKPHTSPLGKSLPKSPATTPSKTSRHHLATSHGVGKVNDSKKVVRNLNAMDKNLAASSPTVAKIPCHIVRQRVDSIQTPHSSNPSKSRDERKNIEPIRKSLAGVFDQRKSINASRKSGISGKDDDVASEDFGVTVAVRVRPFCQREMDLNAKQVVFMNGNETVITDGVSEHSFLYDHSFWSADKQQGEFASQRKVYEKLAQPLLCAAFDGYNTCLFAYGQTGSGKSYTIMGLGDDKGVVPRFCDEMFACILSKGKECANIRYDVQVSYFEIYNEKIHDLLTSSGGNDGNAGKQVLKVREHPESGPYVEGLSKFVVSSFEDVQAWLEVGNRQRATASTGMNDKSSRSHSVFTMNLVQTTTEDLEGEKHESSCRSQVNLVDLAGSERSSTAGTSGQRLKEGASINKSLLTLGKVISTLSERSALTLKRRKRLFVPYRDSTLTWILRESLGGNSRTAMIATISPASCHMEETLSTLRYAKQARSIVNLVKVNEDPNARIIRELKAEIAKLKEAYGQERIDPSDFKSSLIEVNSLRQQLSAAEKEKAKVQEEWKRKLEQSEKRKAEEINELKRAGVSFKVDNQLPNLVNLNEDPQLSELLLYMIKRGMTKVGRKGVECDIQLTGALIAPLHCKISNIDDVVAIEPIADARTYVNGEMITKREILHHGDRVIIGGDHFFRLNNPIEVQRAGKKRNSGGKRKDFEFAKLELIERQNERLQREIHEAQLKVKKEMLGEIEAAKEEAEQQITTQRSEYEKEIKCLQAQLVKDQTDKHNLQPIFEQAEVLHREFKNRRNRGLETDAAQLELSMDDVKIQVFASLEAERQKLSEEVERMQQRMANTKKSQESDASSSAVPLRLSLLLQEANTISESLGKQTTFSRHDETDDRSVVMIKVHNTQLGIWTLWSIDKFEEKLLAMRELYNGAEDDELANVFYDPDDEWQEAYTRLDNSNPSSTLTGILSDALKEMNEGPLSVVDKLLLTLNDVSSSTTAISENIMEISDYTSTGAFHQDCLHLSMSAQSLLSAVGFVKSSVTDVTDTSPSVARLLSQIEKACKELVGHITRQLQGCHNGLEQIVKESSTRISRLVPNISKYGGAVTIATNLAVHIFDEDKQQKIGHRLKHAFLQGGDTFMRRIFSGGIDRLSELEKENIADRSGNVESLSSATIQLLKTCMDLQATVQGEVVRSLLNQRISDDSQELYEGSLMMNVNAVPAHYYTEYLRRTQSLIREVGSLVDGVAELNRRATDDFCDPGASPDLRYKAEALWRPTTRIADLCVKHEGLCAIMHDLYASHTSSSNPNTSNNNNNSKMETDSSPSPSEKLCDGVYEASRLLRKALRQFIELADSSLNSVADDDKMDATDANAPSPRRKRILPSSPPLLENNSRTLNSSVLRKPVEKWLQIADRSFQ